MISHPPRPRRHALALLSMSLTLGTALAAPAKPADPADPQAKIPPLQYVGALSRYRPLQEAPAGSWQEANEKANRAGGWRAYAREKAAEEPLQPGPDQKGQKAHEGHKKPQGHQHHQGQHHAPR